MLNENLVRYASVVCGQEHMANIYTLQQPHTRPLRSYSCLHRCEKRCMHMYLARSPTRCMLPKQVRSGSFRGRTNRKPSYTCRASSCLCLGQYSAHIEEWQSRNTLKTTCSRCHYLGALTLFHLSSNQLLPVPGLCTSLCQALGTLRCTGWVSRIHGPYEKITLDAMQSRTTGQEQLPETTY